jgi:hypothetical protein
MDKTLPVGVLETKKGVAKLNPTTPEMGIPTLSNTGNLD